MTYELRTRRSHSLSAAAERTPSQKAASAATAASVEGVHLPDRGAPSRQSARRMTRLRQYASKYAPTCISVSNEGSARTSSTDDAPRARWRRTSDATSGTTRGAPQASSTPARRKRTATASALAGPSGRHRAARSRASAGPETWMTGRAKGPTSGLRSPYRIGARSSLGASALPEGAAIEWSRSRDCAPGRTAWRSWGSRFKRYGGEYDDEAFRHCGAACEGRSRARRSTLEGWRVGRRYRW